MIKKFEITIDVNNHTNSYADVEECLKILNAPNYSFLNFSVDIMSGKFPSDTIIRMKPIY